MVPWMETCCMVCCTAKVRYPPAGSAMLMLRPRLDFALTTSCRQAVAVGVESRMPFWAVTRFAEGSLPFVTTRPP
jgi:hypothetical protein